MFGISVEQRRRKMNEFFKAFLVHSEECEGIDLYCIYVDRYLVGCFFLQDMSKATRMFSLRLAWDLGPRIVYRLYHAASHMDSMVRGVYGPTHLLTHFVVHPQYQRQGIGSEALLQVLGQIDKSVVCTTQEITSLRFYTNMGFKSMGSGAYEGIPNWLLMRPKHTSV
jgi:GNAT superfamily N-acetyltransferase